MREVPPVQVEFFKVLGHLLRLRLLELLDDGGDRSVSELVEQASARQSSVSQQLGRLRRAGLVVVRREGSHVIYGLANERIAGILAASRQILLDTLPEVDEDPQKL